MKLQETIEKLNECTKSICEFKRLYDVDTEDGTGFAMCEWLINRGQPMTLMSYVDFFISLEHSNIKDMTTEEIIRTIKSKLRRKLQGILNFLEN